MARYAMQTAMRAACVSLLEGYATAASLKLQVFPSRPDRILTPTAFVDRMGETYGPDTNLLQRIPTAEIVVLHGLFDSGEAVAQRDAFCDGFVDYARDRFHEAGATTGIRVESLDDDPDYLTDWQPRDVAARYYATRITLEGLALSA